jgi:hypothetical protein
VAGIFGRDLELAAMERFLDGAPTWPSAVVIEGEAGIGKTTLTSALSGSIADDDSPGSDGPRGDQAISNVGIVVSEALNNGAIVGPPNENRSIHRLGQGARED